MFKHISIIAFDLDDTLWPCMPTIVHAEETLYQWLAQHYPRVTQRYSPEQMIELRKQFTASDEIYAVDLSGMRYEFLRYLGELLDYDADQLSRDGFEVFFEARQRVEFYDDVLPCLARLGQRYRLGSISNGNASVEKVGLGHLIEHSVSASDLKLAKPDPGIFHHLADRFEVEPGQIVYVGDHPVYDVRAPLDAGFKAVWINRNDDPWPQDLPEPDHQVADLHQLEALLSGR